MAAPLKAPRTQEGLPLKPPWNPGVLHCKLEGTLEGAPHRLPLILEGAPLKVLRIPGVTPHKAGAGLLTPNINIIVVRLVITLIDISSNKKCHAFCHYVMET